MGSKLETLQRINTIPSKKGRVDAGIKLGLFSPENFLPVPVSPIEHSPIQLSRAVMQKIQSSINSHPIMESLLSISPEQIQLPEQIRALSHLPPDFMVLLEPYFASLVVDKIQKQVNSPGFRVRVLHQIARESLTVGAFNFQMRALQQIAEWRIAHIENGSAGQIARLHDDVNKNMVYVVNGQRMLADESTREEQIQQSIARFHDKAAHVSGLVGRGLGEISCYTLRLSGEAIWIMEYGIGKAVKAGAQAAAQKVKEVLNRTEKRKNS
jgi:hypothetical protein